MTVPCIFALLVATACSGGATEQQPPTAMPPPSSPPAPPPASPPAPPPDPTTPTGSPFDGIALRPDMPRAEAETLIATALHTKSTYNVYGGNLHGGTVEYAGGAFVLEVVYKSGSPAPWVVGSNGVAEHYPPVDESVGSFRIRRK